MTGSEISATEKKWQALADHLISLTQKGKLIWKESVEDDTFITSVGDNVVSIERTTLFRDGERTPIVLISVLGSDGKVIDSFNDEQLGGPYWNKLSDLVSFISRKVSGADEVLDDLLSELSEMK